MDLFVIIMAGGVGSRFWPRSKKHSPKQLLKIFGDTTAIQDTTKRLEGIVPPESIFVVTNSFQRLEVINQLKHIPEQNIIDEPIARNTAACVGYASLLIKNINKNAVTLVLPADHRIINIDEFQKTVLEAAEFARESEGLITIGIKPTKPDTGFGYIQIDDTQVKDNIYKVLSFAEKPNYSTAVRFVESGDFLWNSGIFIWKVETILEEIKTYMPDLSEALVNIGKAIGQKYFQDVVANEYGQLRRISIDYGIMEKSVKAYLIKADFDWTDIGSWEEVYNLSEKDKDGNVIKGKIYTDMVMDSYVYSEDKFTAVIGVENLLIINDKDSLLICRRDKAQEVKKVVEFLKINKLDEYR